MSKDLKNLSNISDFENIFEFELNEVLTWGNNDKEKREIIRQSAYSEIPKGLSTKDYVWGFKIYFTKNKNSKHRCDVDNIPKLILDSFSKKLVKQDESKWKKTGLYKDDSLEYVKFIEVYGDLGEEDRVLIEVYRKRIRKNKEV